MKNNRLFIGVAVCIVILTVFWIAAYLLHDGHLFQRGGALIAAVAAIMVVVELIEGIKLEEKEKRNMAPVLPSTEAFGRERLEAELRMRVWYEKISKIRQQRFRNSSAAAGCAALGEFVHGFGDWLLPH